MTSTSVGDTVSRTAPGPESSPGPSEPEWSGPAEIASPHVVLVDDHPLLAMGLRDRLEAEGHTVAVADSSDLTAVVSWVVACCPRLVVLDLGLPIDGGGLSLIHPLVSAGLKVAVLTGEADRTLWARCSVAGAEVVLSKAEPLDDITRAIDRLLNDQPVKPHQRIELAGIYRAFEAEQAENQAGFEKLTHRESQVLAGLVAGEGPLQLASRDIVSVQTIRCQIKSVLSKLGVNSQLAAVARANACGWKFDRSD